MLTLRDMFAGAGGSSTGAVQVAGVSVHSALNHWQKAVNVHNANHPDALHICADVSQFDPRRLGATDILWASPECTNHSQAKGRRRQLAQPDLFEETLPDEAAERSRATMWDVPRFTEAHRYKAIIVENVVDAYHWPPFQAWLMAMHSYGYEHQIVWLNSMHAQAGGLPAPQSRDRMYVVFWRRGDRRPDLERMQRPKAYCPTHGLVDAMQSWKNPDRRHGRYRQQYLYRCPQTSCRNAIVEPGWLPAAAAIDWALRGQRIGDRDKPLADKTRRRIAAGIARYWQPVHLEAAGHRNHHGLVTPYYGTAQSAHSTDDPLGTLTTVDRYALVMRNNGGGAEMTTPIHEVLRTLTTAGHQSLLMTNTHTNRARPTSEPAPTMTTAGGGGHALVTADELAAAEARVDDCLFRMLEPSEVAAGMAFPGDYVWEGTRRERVRMAGNAVTPPAARDLIGAVVEALTGESAA